MDNGAHYHCCDFQVHTPRDRRWHGKSAISDAERQDYARRLIKACREKGVEALAITDHHDMALVEFAREAAAAEVDEAGRPIDAQRQVSVFPGIELTLAVPCQALIIFDANFAEDLFALAMNSLAIQPSSYSDSKCAKVVRLNFTDLEDVYEALNKHDLLRGRFILLPNVSQGGDHTLLRVGHTNHYKNMPCVGGYLDGDVNKLHPGTLKILSGEDAEYGNKALGLFQTSDSRRDDFADLGTATTWVKWAEPTAEALRQACLARQSRLSQERPRLPSVAVTSINVSNSAFMGTLFVEFNPQFNAIIGGRGTGKSTVLEYLRWALCDEAPSALDTEELPSYHDKRRRLIANTLTAVDANVQVSFIANDVPHVIQRNSKTGGLFLKIGAEEFESCTESVIRDILPIQAYSQKQLSNVAVRIDELNRFVRAPITKQLKEIDATLADLSTEIRTAYATLRQKRTLERTIEVDKRELRSLLQQVESMTKGLKGLGEKEREVLAQRGAYEEEEEIVAAWSENVVQIRKGLDTLLAGLEGAPAKRSLLPRLPNVILLKTMEDQVILQLTDVVGRLKKISEDLLSFEAPGSPYAASKQQWDKKHVEFLEAYEHAKKKSDTHRATLDLLAQSEARAKQLKRRVGIKDGELKTLRATDEKFRALRAQWYAMQETKSQHLAEQCQNLTNISGSRIRATLAKGAMIGDFASKLREAFSGCRIRSEKVDALSLLLTASDEPSAMLESLLWELEGLAWSHTEDSASATGLPATPLLSSAGFSDSELQRMAHRLTPEAWIDLSLVQLQDKPVFEYRRKEDEYIAFEEASAGQQATSLLWALLNQDGPPLIIDQPEDDLDSGMILEIVEEIWRAKQRRQLIFSSHNANIVVNGDAELVLCCDYRVKGQQSGGQVKLEGAIDVAEVRSEITKVTEGGPKAFKLRAEKYGF